MTTTNLTGKRFRSLIRDCEEDDEYGEVEHPVGSIFVVGDPLHVERCDGDHGAKGHVCGQMYAVLWENAVASDGVPVPPEECQGMWTIWSADEIAGKAKEEPTQLSVCQDCSTVFTEDELVNPIPDLEQRVSSGEPMPSGECPKCGALCQEMNRGELLELLLEHLEDTGESSDSGESYMVMGNINTSLLQALGMRKEK